MKKLLVIIPAFNEEDKIGEVLNKIPRSIPGIGKIEILVINDGSTDATSTIANNMGIGVIDNYKNMGLGFSFRK